VTPRAIPTLIFTAALVLLLALTRDLL
jgi:hypothetical protein